MAEHDELLWLWKIHRTGSLLLSYELIVHMQLCLLSITEMALVLFGLGAMGLRELLAQQVIDFEDRMKL